MYVNVLDQSAKVQHTFMTRNSFYNLYPKQYILQNIFRFVPKGRTLKVLEIGDCKIINEYSFKNVQLLLILNVIFFSEGIALERKPNSYSIKIILSFVHKTIQLIRP